MLTHALPQEFDCYFWDINPRTLDIDRYGDQVIGRILEYGNTPAIIWILKQYPLSKITNVVMNYRDLSRKTGLFWQRLLSIPEKEIKCLQIPYHPVHYGV